MSFASASFAHDPSTKSVKQTLQDILRTNRGWQYGVSATYNDILQNARPCLEWPYRTPPPDFIDREITPGSKFLKLPPILYIVSFQCSVAVKYLRHMVNTLGVDLNAEYAIEGASGAPVGLTTPLGWLLYITRWRPNDYYAHAPMLHELLRLGADPNTPVMTNFKSWQRNSPLYVALVNHIDPTMFFARQLMDYGATFSVDCDAAPLVAAMRSNGCEDVIDLFEDNVAALGGTQNENAFDHEGYTAMHFFLERSLTPFFATDDSLCSIKHYVEVLNKVLHVSMRTTNSLYQLPSVIVNKAALQATTDDRIIFMRDLLNYVVDLEKHEPRLMTQAVDRVLQPLPFEVGGIVRGFLDKRFAKRLPINGPNA
jgi:hypothetical protein